MAKNLESLGRLRLQGILLLAVVFLIGGLAGVAFERARRGRPALQRPPHHEYALPPRLQEQLQPTQEQADRIREILEANRPRTDAVLDEFLPRLRAIADSIRSQVRAVLTPEQQEIFDEWQPPLGAPPLGAPPLRGGPPPHGAPPLPGGAQGEFPSPDRTPSPGAG